MVKALNTAPSVYPVSLVEVKRHLRLNSIAFIDSIATSQTIAPGSHDIAASYSLTGSAIDVSGSEVVVLLESGTNGSGGTVDVKLQESSDGVTFTDVASGSFDQVTEANDNATYELAYSGRMQYIRAAATVAVAACVFGVTVVEGSVYTAEDDYLNSLIYTATQHVEEMLGKALITQTWDFYFDAFPRSSNTALRLNFGRVQSVTITYYDTNGDANTFSSDYYDEDKVSDPGRVVLKYGQSWPSETLQPMNPVKVTAVMGYGAAATNVPYPIRQFMLILIATMYANRESEVTGTIVSTLKYVVNLLGPYTNYSKDEA